MPNTVGKPRTHISRRCGHVASFMHIRRIPSFRARHSRSCREIHGSVATTIVGQSEASGSTYQSSLRHTRARAGMAALPIVISVCWRLFFTWVRVGLTKPEATGGGRRIGISD